MFQAQQSIFDEDVGWNWIRCLVEEVKTMDPLIPMIVSERQGRKIR